VDTSQFDRPDQGGISRPRFCTSCGSPASTGRFCADCGAALQAEPATRAAPGISVQPSAHVPGQPDARGHEQVTVVLPQMAGAPEDHAAGEGAVDDSAPLGLHWVPDEEAPGEQAESGQRRRRPLLAAVAVVAVTASVAAAVLVAGHLGGSDVRTALTSSTREFNTLVAELTAATDSSDVAAAAGAAATASERVGEALQRLDRGSDAETASVQGQLEAERDVLRAVAELAEVDSAPIVTWSAAHDDLASAVDAESETRRVLAQHHDEAAADLGDTSAMVAQVGAAVGAALVDDAAARSARLLETLQKANATADLREVGDAAAPHQAAVAAAAKVSPEGDAEQVLSGYAAGLAALAELSRIDAERTGTWSSTRVKLAQAFGQAVAAGATGGASVGVVLDTSLASADRVVAAADAAIADWKAKTGAAIDDRQADSEALEEYASYFRSQAKTYEQLRIDLSTFTDRVEDPNADVSYFEAYEFLSQAAQDRRFVRDAMVAMDVPAGVRSPHEETVAAIDRAISAVQSAYDGLEQSEDCFYYDDCPYYRDTPGWRHFQAESAAIGEQYASALERWEAATAGEKAVIANRALPPEPQV
jgi:hypothetical protein